MNLLRVGAPAGDWREAIAIAGELLVEAGNVRGEYVSAMVKVVEQLGPYIVLVDGFALAHAEPGELVLKDSIALAVLQEPVDFGGGKMVKCVFALAATNHENHIESLGTLAEILANEQSRSLLLTSGEEVEIKSLLSGVLGE